MTTGAKKLLVGVGVIVTLVAVAIFVVVLGAGPPSAASIIKGDGFHVVQSSQGSQLNASAQSNVTSEAVGISNDGSQGEFVAVLTDQGQQHVSVVEGIFENAGLSVNLNGDVLKVTGPPADFETLP